LSVELLHLHNHFAARIEPEDFNAEVDANVPDLPAVLIIVALLTLQGCATSYSAKELRRPQDPRRRGQPHSGPETGREHRRRRKLRRRAGIPQGIRPMNPLFLWPDKQKGSEAGCKTGTRVNKKEKARQAPRFSAHQQLRRR
jgi:hypothetical protein